MFFKTRLVLIIGFIFTIGLFAKVELSDDQIFSRKELIEDTKQLASMIESIHPQPYGEKGGKIAFHRKLHQTLLSLPEKGMTQREFYRLLLPFVAMIQDAHTRIYIPSEKNDSNLRIPIGWGIVENFLYVARVYVEEYRPFLGALLMKVNNVSYSELVKRQSLMAGAENPYGNLNNLMDSLISPEGVVDLIPESKGLEKVRFFFQMRSGEARELEIGFTAALPVDPITLASRIELPSKKERDPDFGFLDREKTIALLRLDNLISYREAFEAFRNTGYSQAEAWAKHFFRQFNQEDPPEDYDKVIAGIPSLTDTLRALVDEMNSAAADTLIIDVRRNGGGHSIGCDILVYFLYGLDIYQKVSRISSVERLSQHLFDLHKNRSLDDVNRGRPIPLEIGDYRFDGDLLFSESKKDGEKRSRTEWIDYYQNWAPTFGAEVRSGQYEAALETKNIVVLTSPQTFSGGYWVAAYLYKAGAKIVGVPSGQAGNHFGTVLQLPLKHTGISLSVSTKQFFMFPDDPEKGRLLRPHYELTLEQILSYEFDPNADILLAMEALSRLNKSRIDNIWP